MTTTAVDITHIAQLVNVTKLSNWSEGTPLVKLTVTDTRANGSYVEVPDKATQPTPDWMESMPAILYYYCTPDMCKYYTDYFKSHGCTVDDEHFIRSPDVYDICWSPTDPNWLTDVFISLVRDGQPVVKTICYSPVKLSDDKPSTLVPASTHRLHRYADAYYNFGNISAIRIIRITAQVDIRPDTLTEQDPLCIIDHMFDRIYLDILDPSKPVTYTCIWYPTGVRTPPKPPTPEQETHRYP